MKKELSGVAARVYPLIENTVHECGCVIWDLEFVKEGADRILRITIDTDREGGIGIEDCERVNRAVDPILDEIDPIEDFYYLEVSSPGVERELKSDEHIELSIGQRVLCKLFTAKDGRKSITGILAAQDKESVTVDEDGSETVILKSEIAKLTTVYFD